METKVFPYAWHYKSSQWFLKQAGERTEGSRYPLLASMLFSAFCFEAYLNFLGQEKINSWTVIERKLSYGEKLDFISSIIGYRVDRSRRPFQTIKELFRFRDSAVHAKPEIVISIAKLHKDTGQLRFPTSKWLEMCDLVTATRFHDDVRTAILELHKHSGNSENENPLIIPEISLWGEPPKQGDK